MADDRPKSSGMTSWSRYDPVHKAGNTDHWTKLKCRNNTYRSSESAGAIKVVPEHDIVSEPSPRTGRYPRFKTTKKTILIGDPTELNKPDFSNMPLPGGKGVIQRRWMDNIYQKKAKDGFRYWLINRPKPTEFGKYGMGSYKMVMGIGMAPRT